MTGNMKLGGGGSEKDQGKKGENQGLTHEMQIHQSGIYTGRTTKAEGTRGPREIERGTKRGVKKEYDQAGIGSDDIKSILIK